MSWLAPDGGLRTLDDALALRPDLLAGYRALEARLAAELAPQLGSDVRARLRARIAAVVGVGRRDPGPDDDVLEFAEQLVLDPHGVGEALVARLSARLGPRGVVTLAQAVAVWEGRCRLARALDVRDDEGGR